MTVQAIETRYAGVQFRSRVEARWAILLDGVGVAWDYEARPVRLSNCCYLPDFWLRDLGLHLEIKGGEPTPEEIEKCRELSEAGDDVLLAPGAPDERFGLLWFTGGVLSDERYVLARDRYVQRGFWLVSPTHGAAIGPRRSQGRPMGPMFSGGLERAYAAARSERFEAPRARQQEFLHDPDRLDPANEGGGEARAA